MAQDIKHGNKGIAEVLWRDAEFEANPSLGMTLVEELDQRIESRSGVVSVRPEFCKD